MEASGGYDAPLRGARLKGSPRGGRHPGIMGWSLMPGAHQNYLPATEPALPVPSNTATATPYSPRNSSGVKTGIGAKPRKCLVLFVMMQSQSPRSAQEICIASSKSGQAERNAL